MHNLIRITVLAALLFGLAGPMAAATPNEFYTGLLRRGVASYDASRYADASRQLRLAAFGLVEAVDQYQVAQIYLALTLDKLGEVDRAREAAHRVAVAERVERRYAGLPLSVAVRGAFDALAARLLSATEAAMLRSVAVPQSATPQTATTSSPTPPRTTVSTPPPASKPQQTATPIVTPPATDPEKPKPVAATTPKPAPQPAKPSQTAAATTTTTAKPPATKPATPAMPKPGGTETNGRVPVQSTRPTPSATTTPAATAPRTLSSNEVTSRLTASERALNGGNLIDARRFYRELLDAPALDHDTLIRVAEGLYRARDFRAALTAFNRIGALRRGEEPYRYYVAVAAYETGDYPRAKKELAAALPYIEITPDVARYRSKIESSL
jgi:tetratricopeptide (TPR) repeat protein